MRHRVLNLDQCRLIEKTTDIHKRNCGIVFLDLYTLTNHTFDLDLCAIELIHVVGPPTLKERNDTTADAMDCRCRRDPHHIMWLEQSDIRAVQHMIEDPVETRGLKQLHDATGLVALQHLRQQVEALQRQFRLAI
jgi:hypothetical protein